MSKDLRTLKVCQQCAASYLCKRKNLKRSKFCSARCRNITNSTGRIKSAEEIAKLRLPRKPRPDLAERNRLNPRRADITKPNK